jgi:outer membrane protein
MKLKSLTYTIFLLSLLNVNAHAADLLSVYKDASTGSPQLSTYLNTALATSEGLTENIGTLLPQVTATANISANNFNGYGTNTNYTNANYGVSITQQVFNYSDFANVATAKFQKNSAMATYKSQQQQFILSVAEAYFNVLTAQYNLGLANAQYDFLKKTLDQTQAKFATGIGTYTDVAQARANANTAYATMIENQNNLAIANENLRTFTGKEETNLAGITNDGSFPIIAPEPANLNYWVTLAEAQNPLLLAQVQTENAALATVHANVGNQLPNVFIQANYEKNYYNNGAPTVITQGYNPYEQESIELGVSWTIFAGGELMSRTLQAADQYVSQENTSTNLYRQTDNQTTQDYLSVLASIAQIKAYQQSQVSALASLQEFDAKYKVGTATIVDVLNATQTLYQARFNLAQAMNEYIDNFLSLKADVGTLSEQDLANINQYLKITPTIPEKTTS